jgi:hypothetical protein
MHMQMNCISGTRRQMAASKQRKSACRLDRQRR